MQQSNSASSVFCSLYVSWTLLGLYLVVWAFIFFIVFPNGNQEKNEEIELYLPTLPSSFYTSHVRQVQQKGRFPRECVHALI